MMKKLHIIFIVLVCGLFSMTGPEVCTGADNEMQQYRCESSFILNGNPSQKYVDWNTPVLTSAGAEIISERNQSQGNSQRNTSTIKLPARDNTMLKAGKILNTSDLYDYGSQILLFPSGMRSSAHRLIIFRKLVI